MRQGRLKIGSDACEITFKNWIKDGMIFIIETLYGPAFIGWAYDNEEIANGNKSISYELKSSVFNDKIRIYNSIEEMISDVDELVDFEFYGNDHKMINLLCFTNTDDLYKSSILVEEHIKNFLRNNGFEL